MKSRKLIGVYTGLLIIAVATMIMLWRLKTMPKAEVFPIERTYPDPFLSMLTKNCIKKHCDRISGAVYHNATIECMGMINAADGIAAVDELVFKKGKYTVSELAAAVVANYEGFDELHRDVLSCGKFGRDDNSDEYAVKVADILQRVIRSRNAKVPEGSRIFSPSLHTLDTNVAYGENGAPALTDALTESLSPKTQVLQTASVPFLRPLCSCPAQSFRSTRSSAVSLST